MVKTRNQKATAVCLVMHCTPVSFALQAVITKHLRFFAVFLEFLAMTHPSCDDSTHLSRCSRFGADDCKKEIMCGVGSNRGLETLLINHTVG